MIDLGTGIPGWPVWTSGPTEPARSRDCAERWKPRPDRKAIAADASTEECICRERGGRKTLHTRPFM